MVDKKIAWGISSGIFNIALIFINGIVLLVNYFVGVTSNIEFHILISIVFLLGLYRGGNLIMYEGWDTEEYEEVLPSKNIQNAIFVFIFVILGYLFFTP